MMRRSFAKNDSPMIISVIRERTVRAAVARIKNGEYHGATGFDLHLSCLDEQYKNAESIKQIVDSTAKPILAINYNQTYDFDEIETDEESRIALLLEAVKAGVSAVDLPGYTYDLFSKKQFRQEFSHLNYSFIKGNPREIIVDEAIIEKQIALIEKIHKMGAEVLLSVHPSIPMNTEQVLELALFLEKRNPDLIKIVTLCTNEDELVESFKTMITLKRKVKTRTHFHCCGEAGKLSRIINPILGGYLVFCSDGFTESSNFEQLDLQTAVEAINLLKRF